MQRVRQLIVAHKTTHPEFETYLTLVARARTSVSSHPDTCIECCKALIEGVAKSAIMRLESRPDLSELEKLDLSPLVKRALKLMKENDDVIEDNFVTRAVSVCHAIGEFRNSRSDISHGRAVPKAVTSHYSLSELVMPIAEAIVIYMLGAIFVLHKDEPELDVENTDDRLVYEEQEAFNAFLDDMHPLEGKPLYSLALYQQFYEDYRVQHAAFTDEEE